jgi:hypothetical protein
MKRKHQGRTLGRQHDDRMCGVAGSRISPTKQTFFGPVLNEINTL